MDKYTHIWVRMGMTLSVTRDEMDLLVSDGETPEEQQKCLAQIFEEGRAVIAGDSYIPYCVIDEYNHIHKTVYESREYDLDTKRLDGRKANLSD